jgi:hypothetical protein
MNFQMPQQIVSPDSPRGLGGATPKLAALIQRSVQPTHAPVRFRGLMPDALPMAKSAMGSSIPLASAIERTIRQKDATPAPKKRPKRSKPVNAGVLIQRYHAAISRLKNGTSDDVRGRASRAVYQLAARIVKFGNRLPEDKVLTESDITNSGMLGELLSQGLINAGDLKRTYGLISRGSPGPRRSIFAARSSTNQQAPGANRSLQEAAQGNEHLASSGQISDAEKRALVLRFGGCVTGRPAVYNSFGVRIR